MKLMITRAADWPLRFEAFIAQRRTQPFAWGQNDCAVFAADCVQALTGVDVAPTGLRLHKTEKQALRALQRHGGLSSIATAALGQPVPAVQANVGDVVLAKAGKRDMLGICNGATLFAPSTHGLATLGMSDATLCWRVA
jgi:hypothetical protein